MATLSLNPCFNGRCTSTPKIIHYGKEERSVLILVLMEDALVRTYKEGESKVIFVS